MDALLAVMLMVLVTASSSLYIEQSRSDVTNADADLSLVHFLYWSRTFIEDFGYFEISFDDELSLLDSGFDGSLNTYFLYHGYTDVGTKQWILDTKTELLKHEPCNVISVDYGALVPSPNYPEAVANMYNVSAYTAEFIDWLVVRGGASTDKIHLTGHSLGAHAAGMTAKYVLAGMIDRVTGLDPAGPLFYNQTIDKRLDKSQAHFVDIIHTNGCSVAKGCSGLLDPLGHADFYPDGGSHLAGCNPVTEGTSGCSHQRVTSFWTESIVAGVGTSEQSLTFVSWPCNSWQEFEAGECTTCGFECLDMGFHVKREYVDAIDGLYYLYTNPSSPYAKGATLEFT